MNKIVFLKILTVILVFLLAFTYCIFPAKADQAISLVLDQTYNSGWIYNTRYGSQDIDASDVIYRSNSTPFDIPDLGRYYFSVFELGLSSYNLSSYNEGEIFLQFTLNTSAEFLSNEVLSMDFICSFAIPGYNSSWLNITQLILNGDVEHPWESSAPDYLGTSSSGAKIYRFTVGDFVFDEYTLTAQAFKKFTIALNFQGVPNAGYFQLGFANLNNVVVSGYTPDQEGVVQGLDDVRSEVKKTNDLINKPLDPAERQVLVKQSNTNNNVKQEAESMAAALDQFEAPTDSIQGVNDSLSSTLGDNEDSVSLFEYMKGGNSSEFLNTITIIGVPGLGICFLGYVLYGKKE